MPKVKTETRGFEGRMERFDYHVNAAGEFSCKLPLSVSELLGYGVVKAESLAKCEDKMLEALRAYADAGTTKRKVILYGFKCSAYVWRDERPGKDGPGLVFSNKSSTQCGPEVNEVSFAHGTALDLWALVAEETKVVTGPRTTYSYKEISSSIPKGLRCTAYDGGFSHLTKPHESALDWTEEREAFFSKMGFALEGLIMGLAGFLHEPEAVDRAVALTAGSGFRALIGGGNGN